MAHPIRETIVGTQNADGSTHLSPLGVHVETPTRLLLMPFHPSRTLDNLNRTGAAVVNYTDDVCIFAGCLTGKKTWPLHPCEKLPIKRLLNTLAHAEVEVVETQKNKVRPVFVCSVICEAMHRPFHGFNRAQAAVIELAILVSRLHILPLEEIKLGMKQLYNAYEKTAGPQEHLAWKWLNEKIAEHQCPPSE